MGNSLSISDNNRNINDSLLGKRIKKILINHEVVIDKDSRTNKLIKEKPNIKRGCCMDIVKEDPADNDFISIALPGARDNNDKYCRTKGRCIGKELYGLQIKGNRNSLCNKNDIPGQTGCNNWMKNKCAKQLYDYGCMKVVKKKGKYVRIWDAKNKNCLTDKGTLIYGDPECACINSSTGYTLNNDPSNKIKGGVNFSTRYENPFEGIDGDPNNVSTKYSLNVFGYESQYQLPNVFDSRCNSRLNNGSVQSGESKSYKLPEYKSNQTICLNQINVKDSNISAANFSNIKQTNNCGGGGKIKVEENPKEREVRINKENAVRAKEAERIEREAELARQKEEKDRKAKAKLLAETMKKEEEKKKAEKAAIEAKKEAEKAKKEGESKVNLEKKKNDILKKVADKEIKKAKKDATDTKAKLEETKEKLVKAKNQQEETKTETESEEGKVKTKKYLYYGGGALIVVIAIVLIVVFSSGGSSKKSSSEEEE